MKKTIKVLAIAAMASMTIVACNNNKPAEEPVDSTAIEQVAEEQIEEPVQALDTVAQAPAEETKAAPAAKKATKKQEPKAYTKERDNSKTALQEDIEKGNALKTEVKKEVSKHKKPTL